LTKQFTYLLHRPILQLWKRCTV